MPAAKLNLPAVEKGATYEHTLIWKDKNGVAIDLTDCTAKMQVRTEVTSATVLLELSTENGRLNITPAAGQIDLYISSTDTTALAGAGGVYDLEIYFITGKIVRLIEGKLVFKDEVTRG